MSTAENIFRFFVRLIFLFAYGAFLWASIHHIAYFYHNFEGTADWTGPYALAISIDVTSLVLAAGLMFFSRNMSRPTMIGVGFFVLFLTAFSWIVNWEYAARFQTQDLTTNPLLHMLNPILASSFAFLNLAYSIVSGVFTAKPKTAEELAKEADRLESLEEAQKRIINYQERNRKPGFIQRAKETAKEAKAAIIEVRNDGHTADTNTSIQQTQNGYHSSTSTNLFTDIEMDGETPESMQTDVPETRTRRALYITFEDAHVQTGYSIEYLKKLVRSGQLATRKDDDSRLLVSKLMAYLASHRKGTTGEMPAMKLALVAPTNSTNGHHAEEA